MKKATVNLKHIAKKVVEKHRDEITERLKLKHRHTHQLVNLCEKNGKYLFKSIMYVIVTMQDQFVLRTSRNAILMIFDVVIKKNKNGNKENNG